MYIVFIAGLIPTLKPFFRKNFSNLTNHACCNTHFDGDDGTVFTSTPMPPGYTKAYVSTKAKKSASKINNDDKEFESREGIVLSW